MNNDNRYPIASTTSSNVALMEASTPFRARVIFLVHRLIFENWRLRRGCHWCDVKEKDASLHPPTHIDDMLTQLKNCPASTVVITGGEPLMWNRTTNKFAANGFTVHIETSGAYPLSGNFD